MPNDNTNPKGDKGPSNFDVRQRFVWASSYEFPKWEAIGRMGEGWSASGVLTLMSGHPFSMNYNFIDDYSGSGEFFDRPDIIAAPTYNRSNPGQFLDSERLQIPCDYPLAEVMVSPVLVFPEHVISARLVAMRFWGRTTGISIWRSKDYGLLNASNFNSALTFQSNEPSKLC